MPNSREYTTFFESIAVTSLLPSADADLLFAIPPNHDAEITFLTVTNGGATNNASVQVFHSDHEPPHTDYHYLIRENSIAGNEAIDVLHGGSLYLHSGDKIYAWKGGGTIDVTISGKIYYNPTRN